MNCRCCGTEDGLGNYLVVDYDNEVENDIILCSECASNYEDTYGKRVCRM